MNTLTNEYPNIQYIHFSTTSHPLFHSHPPSTLHPLTDTNILHPHTHKHTPSTHPQTHSIHSLAQREVEFLQTERERGRGLVTVII